jgi:hypothetical protein
MIFFWAHLIKMLALSVAQVWLPRILFVYLGKKFKKIKVMFTAVKKGRKDFMGFTWFEVFKNGKTTGNSYHALDSEHAIAMHKQLKK